MQRHGPICLEVYDWLVAIGCCQPCVECAHWEVGNGMGLAAWEGPQSLQLFWPTVLLGHWEGKGLPERRLPCPLGVFFCFSMAFCRPAMVPDPAQQSGQLTVLPGPGPRGRGLLTV